MFHLLVSYQEWSSSGGSLANSRVYINKNEEPGSSFYTNGTLDTSKVFSIDAVYAQDRNLVSVMMPFSTEFNTVYTSIQASTVPVGLSCVRADDIWEEHAIIQDVVNIIARARVVICDCSGKNPNVFYEAGIAHTLGKEVILIAQSKDDIPFDLRHLRCIFYLSNTEGLETLSQSLQTKLRSITG